MTAHKHKGLDHDMLTYICTGTSIVIGHKSNEGVRIIFWCLILYSRASIPRYWKREKAFLLQIDIRATSTVGR